MSYETCPISPSLLAEVKKEGKHLTMVGRLVEIGSPACIEDLKNRIDDTAHFRDLCCTRSDERSYYNGVLKVLRRKLREAERSTIKESIRTRAARSSSSNRVLKLAGII